MNARTGALAKGVACGEYSKKGNLRIETNDLRKPKEGLISQINMIEASKELVEEECLMKAIMEYLENSTFRKIK